MVDWLTPQKLCQSIETYKLTCDSVVLVHWQITVGKQRFPSLVNIKWHKIDPEFKKTWSGWQANVPLLFHKIMDSYSQNTMITSGICQSHTKTPGTSHKCQQHKQRIEALPNMKNVFLWCVGHLYKQSPAPPQSKVTSGCFPRLQFRVYGSYTCRALGPFETPNLVQKVCLCWLVTGKTVTTTSLLTVFVLGISTTLSLHKNNSNTVLNLTCTYWQSLVHITKAYMRAVRRCFLGCTSSSQNSFSDSVSPSDGSFNCVSWEECWENVFSIVLFLCIPSALAVLARDSIFFWAAVFWIPIVGACCSLYEEKK